MRHRKHSHQLGVKKEHRQALIANLATALFIHGRIETTLAKARALRPFAERIITLAKKAAATDDAAKKLHFRRLAIARVRDKAAVKKLFDERASEFADRQGGYTRIYKIGTRVGDAAEMALIELIAADDEGYAKRSRGKKPAANKGKADSKQVVEDKSDTATAEDAAAAVELAQEAAEKAEEAAAEAKEAAAEAEEAAAQAEKVAEEVAEEESPKAEPKAKEDEPKKD